MTTIPIKMNLINVFNEAIEFTNQFLAAEEKAREDVNISFYDATEEMESRSMEYIDIKFRIAAGYFEKIGKRAIELGDKELIEHLECLGILGISNKEEPS